MVYPGLGGIDEEKNNFCILGGVEIFTPLFLLPSQLNKF